MCKEFATNVMGGSLTGLMHLPLELKERILHHLPPGDRCRLRLVNRAMRKAVEESMRDVVEIGISHANESSTGGLRVIMKTKNPETQAIAIHDYRMKKTDESKDENEAKRLQDSPLYFLLRWAGSKIESLSVMTSFCFASDNSRLKTVQGMFQALNDGACPKLERLNVSSCRFIYDNTVVLEALLNYVTKRRSESLQKSFLESLSLIAPPNCCEKIINLQMLSNRQPSVMDDTQKLLQQVLAQCQGLKKLDMDSVLIAKSLSVTSLHYPSTLTHLKTARLCTTSGEREIILANCPNLQIDETRDAVD